MNKRLNLIGIVLAIILSFVVWHGSKAETSATRDFGLLSITANDLASAGYARGTQQRPQTAMYLPPNVYFWVHEDPNDNSNNLLMVSQYHQDAPFDSPLFDYGAHGNVTSHSVDIPGGRGQEAPLLNDGRIALNFAKGNYYIVIIGPNSQKVERLAVLIAEKIQ
ncbi:hypothetical protein KGQ34_04065 [Patescibacteria group bacterium]|nr:hypothetical protein [Patescibacteria group bacterium]